MKLSEFGDSAIYVIEEIIKESLSNQEDVSIMVSLLNIRNFTEDIDLLTDDDNNVLYSVKLKDLIKNGIEESDLFNICCQGWVLSDNKDCLIKKI
ncbi:MAG: hypothetical protein IKT40_08865 [Bacilli bacterium]|nr:hypothetical protein [Bacilli bacterium]